MRKIVWENQSTVLRGIRYCLPKGLNYPWNIAKYKKGKTLAYFNDLGEPKQFTRMPIYFDWNNYLRSELRVHVRQVAVNNRVLGI